MSGRKSAGDEKRLHALVSGRVQGVGFRYYVQREATRLKLNGWVRNLGDGNVEVMVQGPPDAVDEMLKKLREGPPFAWVRDVVTNWKEPDPSLVTFEVRHTGW
ncbi:MAG: acylphosphatase [Acidobacteriota bacterium]|jgi:acylphosphatase|nr:acylphosphatase [Acidobacteriota bacterium]